MDPNSVLFVTAMGAILGIVLGFMVSGEGYGWFFNAIAGAVGAIGGGHLMASTGADMGPMLDAGIAACAASGLSAMVLRT